MNTNEQTLGKQKNPYALFAKDLDAYFASQSPLFKKFLLISIVAHIIVVIAINFIHLPNPFFLKDIEIETSVVSERDFLQESKETVLPQALKAEDEAVHRQILPQLPKAFEIDKAKPDDSSDKKPDDKTGEDIKESKELQDQIKEQDSAPTEKEPVKGEKPKPEEKQENKVDETDLKKRLALEALRKEQKFADQIQAPKTEAIAKLRKELALQGTEGRAGVADLAVTRYFAEIKKAIEHCYTIPDTYNIKRADVRALIAIKIEGSGKVSEVNIVETNDDIFAQIVVQGINTCTSIPPPPRGEPVEANLGFKI